jgi:gliding motility-associated-like protein
VVTDPNACTASVSVVVTQPAPIQDSIVRQNVKCKGGSDGSLTVYPYGGNAPFTYLWNDGSTTQNDSMLSAQAQPYSVTITDNTGCTASDTASLTEPPLLTFTHSETQVKCPGEQDGTITAIGAGGTPPYNFSVTQDGANFINAPNGVAVGLDSGLYNIYLSDNNGCLRIDTAYIKSPVPDLFIITVDSTSCFGSNYTDGSIYVTALTANNMPYTYTIDNGATQDTSYFGNLGAGHHQIIATNQFGCNSTLDTIVPQPQQGYASVLPKDTTLQLGQSVMLFSAFYPFPYSDITSYNWVPSEGLSCVDCPSPLVTPYSHVSQYVLTITYNNDCIASDSMQIIVVNNAKFFVPNSFSPNGDGNNDIFEIYGEDIKTVVLRVFNRWGEKVFESNNQFNGWDGTYKGIMQMPGVYTYDAQIIFLDDTKAEKHGSITLIR